MTHQFSHLYKATGKILVLCLLIFTFAFYNKNDTLTCSFFFNGSTAPWGPRPPPFSRLHDHTLDTPHWVGLLWTRDQLVAETSTWQHTTFTRDRHPCPCGISFLPVSLVSLWSTFVLFKSFRPSCHFTFHATVLTTNTTQTSMPPVGFEPMIPVSEWPKTNALDRTATGIGNVHFTL
jgi:hypothetical protein